ncbi:MAG: amidohydrolase family protein [Deltaproteobacteria bacterium]
MEKVNRRTLIKLAGLSMAAASLGFPGKGMAQKPTGKKPFRKICVEEHFSTTDHINYLLSIYKQQYPMTEVVQEEKYILADVPFLPYLFLQPPQIEKLYDLGEGRLEEMDKCGIDMQVLSLLSPGVQVFEAATATRLARDYNNRLAAAVKDHPKRFAGFACLAPQDPKQAADELERAVKDLGFKGAGINSHTKGEYLDDKKYWVIFERAQKLNVPIYLHPRSPSPDMMKPFIGYPMLDSAMWGFGAEAGLHSLRLILSGLFDEFPRLKIILGHLGETIPFVLARIDNRWSALPFFVKKLKKLPGQYFRDNFLVTTSGMNEDPATLIATISILGSDRILFATDYPLEDAGKAVSFIDNVPINDQDKAKICHLNAERVFSL